MLQPDGDISPSTESLVNRMADALEFVPDDALDSAATRSAAYRRAEVPVPELVVSVIALSSLIDRAAAALAKARRLRAKSLMSAPPAQR